jgi:hypothetical protein
MPTRHFYISLPIILSIFSIAYSIVPVSSFNIADKVFTDKWCYQDGDDNLRFFTLADGEMWAFKWTGSDSPVFNLRGYHYGYNNTASQYEFSFVENIHDLTYIDPDIGSTSDYEFTFPPVAFSVGGKNFVYDYYRSKIQKDVSGYRDYIPYYYRLMYQTNPPSGEWLSHDRVEMEHGPLHETDPNKPIYRSAHVEGDTVYLIYDSYVYLDTVDGGLLDDDINSEIYYYPDNSLYIDVCILNNNNLTRVRREYISNAMHDSKQHPQHISGTKIGNDVILFISYDAGYTSDHEHYGGGVIIYNATKDVKIDDRYFSTARVLRAVPGSIQGEDEVSPVGSKNHPIRFQTFFNHLDDNSPDSVKLFIKTYSLVPSENSYTVDVETVDSRRVMGVANVGDGWGDLMMDVAVRYQATNETDSIPGNETVKKYIYLFRNDAAKIPWGHKFNSDRLTINYGDSAYVESRDFGPSGDSKYEKMNRRLWTLIGIYEGAPHLPMNWQRWLNKYSSSQSASSLTIQSETNEAITIDNKSTMQLYGKLDLSAGISDNLTVSTSFKYTKDWINSLSVTSSITSTQMITSLGTYTGDSLAVLLWSVPNIARADLSVFPWWATENNHRIPNSSTVAIWNLAPNDNLVFEEIKMEDPLYAPLFGVTSSRYRKLTSIDSLDTEGQPLDSVALDSIILARWNEEWTRNNVSRKKIQDCATEYTSTPQLDFTWSSSGTSSVSNFTQSESECNSRGTKTNVAITVGTKLGLAKVFTINMEVGTSLTFENQVSYKFTTTNGFKLAFGSVMSGSAIRDNATILANRVSITSYLFNNETAPYWYYDILDTEIGDSLPEFRSQRPWYLSYVASPVSNGSTATQSLNGETIKTLTLSNVTPNPFNPSTQIHFTVPSSADGHFMSITIFDTRGKVVSKLFDAAAKAGHHALTWDGLNENKKPVASGIYIVSLKFSGTTLNKPITLSR